MSPDSGIIEEGWCHEHNMDRSQYCKVDDEKVCIRCLVYGSHVGHESLDLDLEQHRIEYQKIIAAKRETFMSEIIEVVQYRRDSLDHSFKSLQGKINKALQTMYEKATQELDLKMKSKLTEINKRSNNDAEALLFLQYVQSIKIVDGSIEINFDVDSLSQRIIFPSVSYPKTSESLKGKIGNVCKPITNHSNIDSCNNPDFETREQNSTVLPFHDKSEKFMKIESCSAELESLSSILSKDKTFANNSSISELCKPIVPSHVNPKETIIEVISIENPDRIYIRGVDEAWLMFQSELNLAGSNADFVKEQPVRGQQFLCYYKDKWTRAVFKSSNSVGLYNVKLVDFGQTVTIDKTLLRKLDRKLKAEECVVECVKLAKILPSDGSNWSKAAVDLLRSKLLSDSSPSTAFEIIKKTLGDEKDVDLIIRTRLASDPFGDAEEVLESVSEFLLKKGVAIKSKTLDCLKPKKERFSRLSPLFIKSNNDEVKNAQDDFDVPVSLIERVGTIDDNLTPRIPQMRVFSAQVSHIDVNYVVWIIPEMFKRDLRRMTEICCKNYENQLDVLIGGLYVIKINSGKNIRGRILKSIRDFYSCIDVDSGKRFRCGKSQIFQIPNILLQLPPLAVPTKLYGLQMTDLSLNEEEILHELKNSKVTVAVVENCPNYPIPVNIFYTKFGKDANSGNLGKFMLKYGYVRLCTSYEDWIKEMSKNDAYLFSNTHSTEFSMRQLPHPLPVSVGSWIPVAVEGLEYPIDGKGEEKPPNINTKNCNRVGCRLENFNTVLSFIDHKENKEIKESLRIIENQVNRMNSAFENMKKKLSVHYGKPLNKIEFGQNVLACWGDEWCRGRVECVLEEDGAAWVYFIDYGHKDRVDISKIRQIDENYIREPVFIKDLYFTTPKDNSKLKSIRKEIFDSHLRLLAKVERIGDEDDQRMEKVYVSFWKVLEAEGVRGTFDLVQIC